MSTVSAPEYVRVAIVTGGAQGLGRAIALRLAADGLNVAVNDVPSKADLLATVVNEVKALGSESIALTYDVSKEEEVQSMVEQTVIELGHLDVVSLNISNCVTR